MTKTTRLILHTLTTTALTLMTAVSSTPTQAQVANPQPKLGNLRELLIKGIYERSPLGRYQKKDYSPGVKSFRNDPRCNLDDLKTVFTLQEPPQTITIPDLDSIVRDKDSTQHIRTRDLTLNIRDYEERLRSELATQMNLFVNANDPVVRNREICLTSANFAAPNAVSIGYGFMAFDPQLFYQIIRSEKSNGWSLLGVVAHEFAHQLQVWHNSPTYARTKQNPQTKEIEPYVRDRELEADCVASAILAQVKDRVPNPERDKEAAENFHGALFDGFISLGDFELGVPSQHHGTSYERSLMVSLGLHAYEQVQKRKGDYSSQSLLSYCLNYIDRMNAKFGADLWPFGSTLPFAQ